MGSNPMPSADHRYAAVPSSMVKWTSSLASNEVFRVRVLVGVLTTTEGLPRPTLRVGARDGSRLEAGRAMSLVGSTPGTAAKRWSLPLEKTTSMLAVA